MVPGWEIALQSLQQVTWIYVAHLSSYRFADPERRTSWPIESAPDGAPTIQPNAKRCNRQLSSVSVYPTVLRGMSDVGLDEISRILHSSFQGGSGPNVSKTDLSRMWSLELQWFSPEASISLVERLHASGWLVGSPDSLGPPLGVELEKPPLGWQPLVARDATIPEAPPPSQYESAIERPSDLTAETHGEGHEAEGMDEEGAVQALVSLVSRRSGLDRREVLRRAQRKRRALGPVTMLMSVALLAREQGLEMHEVLELMEESTAVTTRSDFSR